MADRGIDMNMPVNYSDVQVGEDSSENAPINNQEIEHEDRSHTESEHIGHENNLTLQQVTELIQGALVRMERMVDAKLSSREAENQTPPSKARDGHVKHVEDEAPRTRSDRVPFKSFKGCGAVEFSGTVDPVVAYGWLDTMEKVFDISHCWEVDKVTYAAGMFTGRALEWWNSTLKFMSTEQRRALTWKAFSEKFLLQYCPPDLQRMYAREFLELRQNDMTVAEYETEFHRKAKFAAQYLTSEKERIERFIEGLRVEIREFVELQEIYSIEKAVEYARRRERTFSRRDSELIPPPKRPFTSLSSFSRPTQHLALTESHNHSQSQTRTQSHSQA